MLDQVKTDIDSLMAEIEAQLRGGMAMTNVAWLTSPELALACRTGFAPGDRASVVDALAARERNTDVNTDVPWAMAGPSGADAAMRHYSHDAWNSVSSTIKLPTKGAVRLFTKSVAMECAGAKDGIRVNSVHPGIIETPIWLTVIPQGGVNAPPDLDAMSQMAVPLGVKGFPEDIANGVLWLASDESRYVTGAELVIDGGLSVR